MITNIKYVGQCKPIDRADRVVSPGTTEQPVLLGLNTDARGNASADTGGGGPDVNSAKQGELVDRSGPVGPQSTTEQSALLGLKMDGTENTPVCQGGPAMISAGRGEPVDRSGPVGSQSTYEQPVLLGLVTDDRGNATTGPVDHDLILAGRGETVDGPLLVGSHIRTEQSVFLGLDVDRVEHVPASTVVPDVMMYRNQSFADRPVDQDDTRRPVGTEWMHAENDADRPTAGGPVALLFNSDPLCPSGMPFLNDLHQPLAVGPVGQPIITGPLGKHVSEPDCRRTNRIHSGPGGSTGVLDTVNQTGSDVPTDRLNIGCRAAEDPLQVNRYWFRMTLSPYRGINRWTTNADVFSRVKMSDEEMYNRHYHPFKSSLLQWDKGVLPEASDPEFVPCVERLVHEALARDEDPLVDNEYPELISCMVKSFRMLWSTWKEHDVRLREQGTVCTTPGCQCYRRDHIMFRKFANGMETDDSESEEIADWDKRSYGMRNTDSYSEGVVPRTYTPPPPPTEETRPEVCKPEET